MRHGIEHGSTFCEAFILPSISVGERGRVAQGNRGILVAAEGGSGSGSRSVSSRDNAASVPYEVRPQWVMLCFAVLYCVA